MDFEIAKQRLLGLFRREPGDHDTKIYLENWDVDKEPKFVSINEMIAEI